MLEDKIEFIKAVTNANKRFFIKGLNYDSLMTSTLKFIILSSHANDLMHFQ